jgi:hypothetical protein
MSFEKRLIPLFADEDKSLVLVGSSVLFVTAEDLGIGVVLIAPGIDVCDFTERDASQVIRAGLLKWIQVLLTRRIDHRPVPLVIENYGNDAPKYHDSVVIEAVDFRAEPAVNPAHKSLI